MSQVGTSLDPHQVAAATEAALGKAASLGCAHAEVRVERLHSQYLSLRDGMLEGSIDAVEVGIGVRVVHDGSMGFAATVDLDVDGAAKLVTKAVAAAVATKAARSRPVELAAEASHGTVSWSAPFVIDPMSVPMSEKIERLASWSSRLMSVDVVDHVSASLEAVVEEKHYANLAGTTTTQQRVRLHPSIEALAIVDEGASFESMRTIAPPVGRGYEYLEGEGWNFEQEIDHIPQYLAEKTKSPTIEPGRYDLVIDPTNLWLTIHESVGHATELDRALGYEAAYAGTSFVTFDKLGSLQYGSPLMHVTGDRTTPYGLATIGYDDEGVQSQSFDIVNDGLFVGYQLDRQIANEMGYARSNGCAFGCSPLMTPIQRMANISLMADDNDGPSTEDLISGIERGIYIVGDKSWSIDMQRHNFQFTGQRFFLIEHGRLVGQVRDVAYQAETTQFWGSLARLGGKHTYLLAGAMNCGKGQPGQVAPVSHGCPSAVFRDIRILNAKEESGR